MNRKLFAAAGLLAVAVCLAGSSNPAQAIPLATFPAAGTDTVDGWIGHWVQITGIGTLQARLSGPTLIQRSDPYPYTAEGGDEAINTEIVSMALTGDVGGMPAAFDVAANPKSVGMIIDTNGATNNSFPARSFFDIFFEVDVTTPVGLITVHNYDPLRMESVIDQIPPDLSMNPYTGGIWIPRQYWDPRDPAPPIFNKLPELALPLYDSNNQAVGFLLGDPAPIHSPEPGTVLMLVVGGLTIGGWTLMRRRRRKA